MTRNLFHAPVRAAQLALLLAFAAPAVMAGPTVSDDTGREITLDTPAQRIISLAPHITELLFAAGAGEQVVGAVSYSDYPPEAEAIPRVGAYNSVDVEAIVALRPDLVVAWDSGNRHVNLERLRALGIPVFVGEPSRLEDVARHIETLGQLAGTQEVADASAGAFRERLAALESRHAQRPTVRVFYQIWHDPLMTINRRHVISSAMEICGGENVFGDLSQIAPRIGIESVLAADPEAIVASGMDEARPEWLDMWQQWTSLQAVRDGHLYFIHPDLIQRHTPRILDGTEQLCDQLEKVRAARGDDR